MAGGERNKITPENVDQKEGAASSSEAAKHWKTVSLKEVAADLRADKRQLPIGDIDVMYAAKLLASQEISKLRTVFTDIWFCRGCSIFYGSIFGSLSDFFFQKIAAFCEYY